MTSAITPFITTIAGTALMALLASGVRAGATPDSRKQFCEDLGELRETFSKSCDSRIQVQRCFNDEEGDLVWQHAMCVPFVCSQNQTRVVDDSDCPSGMRRQVCNENEWADHDCVIMRTSCRNGEERRICSSTCESGFRNQRCQDNAWQNLECDSPVCESCTNKRFLPGEDLFTDSREFVETWDWSASTGECSETGTKRLCENNRWNNRGCADCRPGTTRVRFNTEDSWFDIDHCWEGRWVYDLPVHNSRSTICRQCRL